MRIWRKCNCERNIKIIWIQKLKILIVDDSITIRKFLRSALESKNYQVTEASSGEEAISLFEQDSFDLVTLDIEMSGSNGYETCKKIRDIEKSRIIDFKPMTPILFVTSNDTIQGRIKGFEAGTTDFITKPFTREYILETIHSILYPKNLFEGINILLVEDSIPVRAMIKRILTEQGCSVVEADNGKIALDIIENDPSKIDLVITDFRMPVMQGDELCLHVKKKMGFINIPFIFITVVADSELILDVFKAGAVDYFVKPFVKEILIAKLKVHILNLLLMRANEKQMFELKKLNSTKDKFFSIIAHDLLNPFSGILSISEILETKISNYDLDKKNDLLPFINANKTAVKSVYDLLENLMQWAKSQKGEMKFIRKNISFIDILSETVSVIQSTALIKKITIDINFSEDIIVYADASLVSAILRNLLTNAIKFTRTGGKIIVASQIKEKFIEISITDTGVGIHSDNLEKIFKIDSKFSNPGTEKEKGTGLGLILCKEFVEKLGGSIWVHSEINKGSKFTFTLPLASPNI